VAAGAAGADDDWRNIVGSEANLRQYLGGEGFRYCLNKTPEELEKEGASPCRVLCLCLCLCCAVLCLCWCAFVVGERLF
jgi:hypothetical protein